MMNMADLKLRLAELRIPEDAYSLGREANESYCIVSDGGQWRIFYSERGHRNNEKVFSNEGRACQYFLEVLLGDGAIRAALGMN
jgi:hypothetical protein